MQGIDLFHKKFTFYILHRESLIITHGMKNLNTLVTSDQGKSGAMAQDTQYKIDFYNCIEAIIGLFDISFSHK